MYAVMMAYDGHVSIAAENLTHEEAEKLYWKLMLKGCYAIIVKD